MSSSRENILNRVSQSLQRPSGAARFQGMDGDEIDAAVAELVKKQAEKPQTLATPAIDPIEQFTAAAKAANADVYQFTNVTQIINWVEKQQVTSTTPIYVELGDLLNPDNGEKIDLPVTSDYTIVNQFGVVAGQCGIAETGSVVLSSSANHATAAGFLLDVMMVVIKADKIVARLEDIWPVLEETKQSTVTSPQASRCVNLITGPSRTADVEQKVQLGAHGPRQLIIGIVL